MSAVVALALGLSAGSARAAVVYEFKQSNSLADGVVYGTVSIEANNSGSSVLSTVAKDSNGNFISLASGDILMTVNVDPSLYDSIGKNFGIDKFAFNFQNLNFGGDNKKPVNIASVPSGWSFTIDPSNSESIFGVFDASAAGTGNDRRNPVIIRISNQGANAAIDNVTLQNAEGYFFYAHVGGFTTTYNGKTYDSHQIGSDTPPPEEAPLDAPAPGGLVLVASMLPFALVLRRKLARREATA